MTMRKAFALVILIPVVVSAYTIFRCSNVVAYTNLSRSIIVATRLRSVEFLDISSATLVTGYFTSLVTFENPTNQTLNMTKLVVAPYQPYDAGSARMALGEMEKSIILDPSETQVIVQLKIDTGSSVGPPSYWIVIYRLKFGTAHYSFTSEMHDSVIQTKGPFSIGENQASTEIITYTLVAVDAWALGLEVIVVLILLQERKIKRITLGPEEKEQLSACNHLRSSRLRHR